VFSDPRKSKVDIVQALGRALRKKEGKDWGYVILPVIYDDATHEIDNENFQEILAIVRGLASNDERIVEYFREKNDAKNNKQSKRDKQFQFEVFSEYIDAGELSSQLQVKLWEKLSRFNWMPFEEAREYVRGLGLKNVYEWRINYPHRIRSILNIPLEPHSVYRENGWISWGNWLGTDRIANINREFLNFEEARQYTRTLNLKSTQEWNKFRKSELFPSYLPTNPNMVYKHSGWISFSDWLGTKPDFDGNYLVFIEAREYIRTLKLGNQKGWKEFVRSGLKPHNIPSNPNTVYKNYGWVNLADWLGSNNRSNKDLHFLNYEDAKKFVCSLKLKSTIEWNDYKQSGNKPDFIPSSPASVYKNMGWKGIGDWLGTDKIANQNRNYLTFEKARDYVRGLCLRSKSDWNTFLKCGQKPINIPFSPDKTYKNLGWINWYDWMGIEQNEKNYLSYNIAVKIVHDFKLRGQKEWIEFTKSPEFPSNIPKYPEKYYKGKGWVNLGLWLGTDRVSNSQKEFLSFEIARNYSRALLLKSSAEWRKFCKSGNKPLNIPSNPASVYKENGWISYGDWLGSNNISSRKLNFLPFNNAREYVHTLNLKNEIAWKEYCKSGQKPENIPANPKTVYKESGWKNLGDWLGTGRIAFGKIEYWKFENARDFVRNLGLKSSKDWSAYCNSDKKPLQIPKSPTYYYKSEWKGWADFLGKDI